MTWDGHRDPPTTVVRCAYAQSQTKPWFKSKKIFIVLLQTATLFGLLILKAPADVLAIVATGLAGTATAAAGLQGLEDARRANKS